MSFQKEQRRKKAEGRNPKDVSKSNMTYNGAPPAQPVPDAPQGQGNMMNNPFGPITQGGAVENISSFTGQNLYPYLDGGIAQERRPIAPPSGLRQGMTMGKGLNAGIPYGAQPQVDAEQARMVEPQYFVNASVKTAQKAGAVQASMGDKNALNPAYQISYMGPIGSGPEMPPMPGAFPGAMDTRGVRELPVQGMPDAQQAAAMGNVEGPMGMKPGPTSTAMGMSTGRGGGRNRKKTA